MSILTDLSFSDFREAFYFLSGILTGLVTSFMSYNRWIADRARKRYAAEQDFALLQAQFLSLSEKQTETANILRALELDVREFRGLLSACNVSPKGGNDDG